MIGSDRILTYLKSGRVHSSLLIVGAGPTSAQRMVLGKSMAKTLLCAKKGCGVCTVCRRIDKNIHPDVIALHDPEEDSIKIESVRQVCHQMEISPLEGVAKVCLVDECHTMTTASANAFLKTLEEPGENRYFFLFTSQPGALLPTILSRCLRFTLKPADEELAESPLLEDFLQTKNITAVIAGVSDKEKCLRFVLKLQERLREGVIADPSKHFLLEQFEGALRLEGRLRSNASYGLLLESYLREHFL